MFKFVLLLAAPLVVSAQLADYAGPSILSRGSPASSMGSSPNIAFRPYIGLAGTYDTDFTGVVRNSAGQLQSIDSLGVQASAGIYGLHRFRHSAIGLNYNGDYRHFPHNPYGDTINQVLMLDFEHEITKRLSFELIEAAGTYTRNYTYPTAAGLVDPYALVLPGNDLFDNRVVYGQTAGNIVYRVSPRLSFRATASGYLVRRRSSSLYGLTGYLAAADAAYRLTRYVTVALFYEFQHFEFTRSFGASDIHMGGLSLATRLSRTLELGIQAGAARVETLFQAAVPVDPAVAAITGQNTAIQAIYNVHYIPSGRIRLTKQMHRATAELSYGRDISAGNGVYLTSSSETAQASISYHGQRHWAFNGSMGYNRLVALSQSLGKYNAYQIGLGVSRDLGHGLQWSLRADGRRYLIDKANFNRSSSTINMGFYWSPGEVPLSLW
jgi:hypothetical protein